MAILSTIIGQVQQEVRDPRGTNYTTDELIHYCRLALEYLCDLIADLNAPFGRLTASLAFSAGDQSKALPSAVNYTMLRLATNDEGGYKVFLADGSRLRLATERQIDAYYQDPTATGQPARFWMDEANFYISPKADASYSVTLHFYPRYAISAVGDTIPWGGQLNDLVRLYMVRMCRERSNQVGYWSLDQAKFGDLKRRAVRVIKGRESIAIGVAPGYGWT